jgi:hypothetical protein
MRAKIYQPARTAMQSGTAKAGGWVLEFAAAATREVDPLMGWTSSGDMESQVRLHFDTVEAAQDYATGRVGTAKILRPTARVLGHISAPYP